MTINNNKRVLARKNAQELNMDDLQKVSGAGADACQGTTQKITGTELIQF